MKKTNAKSVQNDFTYPVGDPPPVVPNDKIEEELEIEIRLMKELLQNINNHRAKILNFVLQVQDEAEQ